MALYTTKSSAFIIISAIETTQPQQWVIDLWQMYHYWAENHSYKVSVLEISPDEHTPGKCDGLSYVTIEVIGDGAYGALQYETGIHRLQQINLHLSTSVLMRHFAAVEVIPVMSNNLEIPKQDLDIIRGWSWRHVISGHRC